MNELVYTVQRSRRKTIVITVREGLVSVRAPLSVSDARIRAFVLEKQSWIERKISEQKDESFAQVRNGKTLLDFGVEKPVIFGETKNTEKDGVFYLKDERHVRRYFEQTRTDCISERLYAFTKLTGLCPEEVSVRDFKARWGSCDIQKRIKLNWRLVMLPAELCDYVLIHELCHMREMNHSAAFWREVERYCPKYREYRKRLKDYAFLTQMYR